MSIFDKPNFNLKAMIGVAKSAAAIQLENVTNTIKDKASEGVDKLKDTKAFQTVKEGSERVTSKIDAFTQTETFQQIKDSSAKVSAQVESKFNELHTNLSPELMELHKKLSPVLQNLKDGAHTAKDNLIKTGKLIDTEVNAYIDDKKYSDYDSNGLMGVYHNNRVELDYKLKRLALDGGLNLYTDINADGSISILSKEELRSTYSVSPSEKYVLVKEDSLKYDFDVRNQIIDALLLMEEQNKISNLFISKINHNDVATPKNEDSPGM